MPGTAPTMRSSYAGVVDGLTLSVETLRGWLQVNSP
jgi:hypothetical protein